LTRGEKIDVGRNQAGGCKQGMQTMRQDGLKRVLKGQTAIEEILRVIASDQL
jgi:type II secretory ATPase GspE/PulE/Tfp pilus assembly ATPase PilB-like protein